MSSILDIENNKDKCQKFTPLDVVDNMLDMAGYTTNLMGKKVLENSFGSGHILKSIVRRYINDAISRGVLPQNISVGIKNDIYGIELDGNLYVKCINELDAIIKEYKLPMVKWSLYNEDALTWENPVSFQFIIGNPPYIAYRYIDDENRSKLKEKYTSCKDGKFDYCYAFIESAISMLAVNGRLVQLIPSNIYKNVFANNLRKMLLPQMVSMWDELNSPEKTKKAYNNVPYLLESNNEISTKIVAFMNTMLSEIEKKQFEASWQSVADILKRIKSSWEADYAWVSINIKMKEDVIYRISEDVLQVITDNLILNSIQQNDNKNHLEIDIEVRQSDELLSFIYKDNGKGLDKKYINSPRKILEVHETTRRNGHGLGMWIVNNTAIMSGGSVDKISGNQGFSIEFTIGGAI